MLGKIIPAILLFAAPAAHADEFCEVLKRFVDDAPNGFASVRGEAQPRLGRVMGWFEMPADDMELFRSPVALPAFPRGGVTTQCFVARPALDAWSDRSDWGCEFSGFKTPAEADKAQQALGRRISACLGRARVQNWSDAVRIVHETTYRGRKITLTRDDMGDKADPRGLQFTLQVVGAYGAVRPVIEVTPRPEPFCEEIDRLFSDAPTGFASIRGLPPHASDVERNKPDFQKFPGTRILPRPFPNAAYPECEVARIRREGTRFYGYACRFTPFTEAAAARTFHQALSDRIAGCVGQQRRAAYPALDSPIDSYAVGEFSIDVMGQFGRADGSWVLLRMTGVDPEADTPD